MLLPALVFLMVAVILATCVGVVAYAAHVRARRPAHSAAGLHRAGVSRHRTDRALSVPALRTREQAEDMRMYPTASNVRRGA